MKFKDIDKIKVAMSDQKCFNEQKFPFCPADAAIVANIPLADIDMIN
jgi:hypothetical protein